MLFMWNLQNKNKNSDKVNNIVIGYKCIIFTFWLIFSADYQTKILGSTGINYQGYCYLFFKVIATFFGEEGGYVTWLENWEN
jgi:hypothetical protein